MSLTVKQWHARFVQQARWTAELRAYLFREAGLSAAGRVIEVGCGTGAVLAELASQNGPGLHGLDLDRARLQLAREHAPGIDLVQGDGTNLPYTSGSFDTALCHFLLLWVADPAAVVREMARVTRRGGTVLALAEPDYGGRIDHPPELALLGDWQARALRSQGADPLVGRRLASLLAEGGLVDVQGGVLGGRWGERMPPEEIEAEWQVLRADLAGAVLAAELDRLYALDQAAWQRGERVLYVPTFYSWGRVPG